MPRINSTNILCAVICRNEDYKKQSLPWNLYSLRGERRNLYEQGRMIVA